MAKKATRPGARKNGFKATWTRFANKRGSRGGARFGDWRKILMHKFVPEPETPDPVSLVIFLRLIGSARLPCAPARPGSKSASQRRTRLPLRYFAPPWLKPVDGAPRIN
jgi:hypothetical protein